MIVIVAAIILCVLFTLMSIFQLLLAFGLPLGRAAYGGKHETLPKNLRIMSLIAVGIFVFGIFIVLERAGLITIFNNPLLTAIVVWIFRETNNDPYLPNNSCLLLYSSYCCLSMLPAFI